MGLEVGVGLLIAGTATKVASDIASANAQYDASQAELALKHQEASELLSREQVNEGILRDQGHRLALDYGSAAAAMGGGGRLGGMLQIKQDIEQNIMVSRREAEFKAKMLNAGADIESEVAGARRTAGYVGAFGDILGAAGGAVYKLRPPKGGP